MATVSAEEQVGRAVEPVLGDIDPAMLDPSKEVPQLAPLMALEEVYRELDTSYRDLQSQVSRLRSELAVTHSARLEELSEKERLFARLSSLLAVLPGGVIILDGDQRVRDANPAAIELLGEPLIGELWVDVVTRNPELDGQGSRARRLSVSSRPLEQYGEQVVLITDTTEVHELQEQLNRRPRRAAMGEMAASLAHQIRTPLASTTLYLSQLASSEMAHEQRERVVDKLGDRLSHMEGLIESMLSFVRGRSPETHLISLRDVLTQLDATVRPSLDSATRLTITPVDDTLTLVGAVDDLVGALSNLVRNAAEVSGGDVHIDIWAGAVSRDWLQIRVQDTGPGIPEDILPRLFDPFFTTRAQGTGLGLAVVAMTVANHGGEVRAQNRPGGGAAFYIDLPLGGDSFTALSDPRSSL